MSSLTIFLHWLLTLHSDLFHLFKYFLRDEAIKYLYKKQTKNNNKMKNTKLIKHVAAEGYMSNTKQKRQTRENNFDNNSNNNYDKK